MEARRACAMPSRLALHVARRASAAAAARGQGSAAAARAAATGAESCGYVVSEEDKAAFARDGYVVLRGVLSDAECAEVIDGPYQDFLDGRLVPDGNDLCDMSGDGAGRDPSEYSVFNVLLPRTYVSAWRGSVFEQRAASIAAQLYPGKEMDVDYDQILAKPPLGDPRSVFAWHQDMGYWPPFEQDSATATFWLSLDGADQENGGMCFVPGSANERAVRPHRPAKEGVSRAESHALVTDVGPDERVVHTRLERGDVSVHNEWVVHSSGPNLSDRWRKGYVLAYRSAAVIEEERRHGFTHSHNNTFNWDTFHEWKREHGSS